VCIEREGVFANFSAGQHHTPANGTASPQSDDIDATSGTEPRRSGTIRLAILEPWHLPDTTEYGEIEY